MVQEDPISTARLRIVSFSEAFLTERYVSWLNDPEVVRFSEQRFSKHTLDSCRAYMQSFAGTPHLFWAIVSLIEEEGHVGNLNAYVDEQNKVADIGILLGEKKVWGKGYGLEAFGAVVDFLFNEFDLRKVTAGTMLVNESMVKLMNRLGMEEDGRRIKHFLFNGQEVDMVHRAIFREKWLEAHKKTKPLMSKVVSLITPCQESADHAVL